MMIVRRPAWAAAVLALSVALTLAPSFAQTPRVTDWAFAETFDRLVPTAPSQALLPRTFDYVATHQTHPKTTDGFDADGSYGTFVADHGPDCSPPPEQHTIAATTHRSNSSAPDPSFYICNGHLMSAMGEVEGYSSTAFWSRQEFDFSNGGVLEWAVNLNAPHERSWREVQMMPREQLQAAAVEHRLGADETYPSERIVLTFTSDSTRRVKVGAGAAPPGGLIVEKDQWPGWAKAHEGDPAITDRSIRRRMRVELQSDQLAWGIEQADGQMDWMRVEVPGGLPFSRGLVLFTTHAYTPEKDGNRHLYTFHWDDIRFSGPKLPPYEAFEAADVVVLSSAAGGGLDATAVQQLELPRVGSNPVLFGQVHSGMRGQVLVRINGGPEIEVRPHSAGPRDNGCYFGTWRSFRVPLDAAQLRVGVNSLEWRVGPRPACATGQWWWDGYAVKGTEIQLDP